MKKKNPPQQTMMFDHEDLPLFSGTPVPGSAAEFVPAPAPARQLSIASCPLCLDTGQVGDVRCTCARGQEAEA